MKNESKFKGDAVEEALCQKCSKSLEESQFEDDEQKDLMAEEIMNLEQSLKEQ